MVFREIGKGYSVPLGVWQVRENVRNAMKKKPSAFASYQEAVECLSRKLRIPMKEYTRRSVILQQRRLNEF